MTKYTLREVERKVRVAELTLYAETQEEARACMQVLPVGDQDRKLLELSVAVLMELSMMVSVEGEDIYLDDELVTAAELIETAVELLDDTIAQDWRPVGEIETWEDKSRFYTLLGETVDMTGDHACWENVRVWRDAIHDETKDEAYVAYSMCRILFEQLKVNTELTIDAETLGWEPVDIDEFTEDSKDIVEYIRRLKKAYKVSLEEAVEWYRD